MGAVNYNPIYLYFVYRHIRLDKNEVFYIGIGRKRLNRNVQSISAEYERAYTKSGRGSIWNNIINKSKYKVEIIMESNDLNFIMDKEIELIQLYGRKDLNLGSLANHTDGGEGINNVSSEARAKISKGLTGIKRSEETKQKVREANLGKTVIHSEETKAKISKKNSGKGNGMYGVHGKDNKQSKPILQYDLKGNFIKEWVNGREVEEVHPHISYKEVSSCAINKRSTSKGYIWRFKIEDDYPLIIEIPIKKDCSRPVNQLTLSGEFIKEWRSLTQAEKELKLRNISSVICGRRNHAGGFKWEFKN